MNTLILEKMPANDAVALAKSVAELSGQDVRLELAGRIWHIVPENKATALSDEDIRQEFWKRFTEAQVATTFSHQTFVREITRRGIPLIGEATNERFINEFIGRAEKQGESFISQFLEMNLNAIVQRDRDAS